MGFFHIIALCWLKIVFLNSFFSLPSGATYVLRCPALRRCFPAAGASSCRVFFYKKIFLCEGLGSASEWSFFLSISALHPPPRLLRNHSRMNGSVPSPPSSVPKTSGGDGSDRPRQLPPPAGQSVQLSPAAPLGLAYYLFQVTRDEQILCAWPLPCSWSLSHAYFSHCTGFLMNVIPCKHENKNHCGSQICSKTVVRVLRPELGNCYMHQNTIHRYIMYFCLLKSYLNALFTAQKLW